MKILPSFSKKLTYLGQSLAVLIGLAAFASHSSPLLAAATVLAPGDIVFTGYITNGTPDSFSFVALVALEPGTQIYFTDTGWTGSNFFEVTDINADGERITRFTANNRIAAGTIIRSIDTAPDFTWTTSGPIGPGGAYTELSFGQQGDQISAVQSTNLTNPLLSGYTAIAQIDYTGAFEPATSNGTGDILPNLSQDNASAILFNNAGSYAAFNLNTLSSGTPSEWRAVLKNPANWTFNATGTDLPTGAITFVTAASITTQPVSQSVTVDSVTTINVVAGGTAPLSYQWYQGNSGDTSTPIAGATNASFTTPLLTTDTNYWVRVSNSVGSVDSVTVLVMIISFIPTDTVYLPVVLN